MRYLWCLFLFCSFFSPTLEEKVGQMIVTSFLGNQWNEETKILVEELHVGGMLLFRWTNGLDTAEQVSQLIRALQVHTRRYSLFIAIDHEGGHINRLEGVVPSLPSQREILDSLVYSYALHVGQDLAMLGINWNLAPVVDLCEDPASFLYPRTYGGIAKGVIERARAAIRGYTHANILSCIKHFPGHGLAKVDSHYGVPVIEADLPTFLEHVAPFLALQRSVPAIMVSHLLFPQMDSVIATFSRKIVQEFLRETVGFEGLIVTDSLTMGAVLETCSLEEAAIRAVEAGCDILLFGMLKEPEGPGTRDQPPTAEQIRSVHSAIVAAVHSGRLSRDRINQSFSRILKAKSSIELISTSSL